jgi:predicted deacylase
MTTYDWEILEAARAKGFMVDSLGKIEDYPVLFVKTRQDVNNDPKVLIVAGFHGEELAGPEGILQWIRLCDKDWMGAVDVSFVPCVNPWGLNNKKRYGPSGKPTNTGFFNSPDNPSPEGQLLIDRITELRASAANGFLSLHEDVTSDSYYIYTFEPSPQPGPFTREMEAEMRMHFPKAFDGIAVVDSSTGVGPECKNGLIWKFQDGSFEHWMHEMGVPRIAVTETPGKFTEQYRIDSTVEIINKFLDLINRGI